MAANYIGSHLKEFKPFMMGCISQSPLSYKQKREDSKIRAFIKNLKEGKEWGGEESIKALASQLKVNIHALREVRDGDVTPRDAETIKYEEEGAEKVIYIVHRVTLDPEARASPLPPRNHWDSL
jgi:hypothetical protein